MMSDKIITTLKLWIRANVLECLLIYLHIWLDHILYLLIFQTYKMYIIYRVVDRLICYWLYLIPIICCGIVPRCVGWDFKWHFINYGDIIFTHVHVISRCLFKFEFSEGFSGYLFKFELSERISGYLFKFELSELIFGYLSSNFLRETVKNVSI